VTTSQRASDIVQKPLTDPVQKRDRPLPERIRLAYIAWVDADADARIAEDLKTTILEQKKNELVSRKGEMSDANATRIVKARPDWEEYIVSTNNLRTAANKIRADWQFLRDEFMRQQGLEASARQEARTIR